MPAKPNKYVKELINKGHSESEAWEIYKKETQMKWEKAKKLLTGQLITKKYLSQKEKEFTKKEQKEDKNGKN
jgi:hypothetical protein